MKFSKAIDIQLNGTVSIVGSKKLNDTQKRALLGKTVTITVDGQSVTGTLRFSKSEGLTATIAAKLKCEELGVAVERDEKESGFAALSLAVDAEAAAVAARDEQLGLNQ